MTTYSIPQNLLQAIVSNISEQPAYKVRDLLNAIEAECSKQDQERTQQAETQRRESIKAEVLASMAPIVQATEPAPATDVLQAGVAHAD
jgi:hypothetical protein